MNIDAEKANQESAYTSGAPPAPKHNTEKGKNNVITIEDTFNLNNQEYIKKPDTDLKYETFPEEASLHENDGNAGEHDTSSPKESIHESQKNENANELQPLSELTNIANVVMMWMMAIFSKSVDKAQLHSM